MDGRHEVGDEMVMCDMSPSDDGTEMERSLCSCVLLARAVGLAAGAVAGVYRMEYLQCVAVKWSLTSLTAPTAGLEMIYNGPFVVYSQRERSKDVADLFRALHTLQSPLYRCMRDTETTRLGSSRARH